MSADTSEKLAVLMSAAQARYGDFASTHEALGVALEEFNELADAIHANDMDATKFEALDLAAVLIRLHDQIDTNERLRQRSTK